MKYNEEEYFQALNTVLGYGEYKADRTGVGTYSEFGTQSTYYLQDNFPILLTKKMEIKSVLSELLWFIEGSTDERRLAEIRYGKSRYDLKDKKTIWTANANKQGKALGYTNTDVMKELGPVYGYQWNLNDQLNQFVERLKKDPYSRRHIVSAWNPADIDMMALPPCHTMFQGNIVNDDGTMYFDLQLYQRSADLFLGVPYNIVSYALLMHMIAHITGYRVRRFTHVIGDAHIYLNHLEQCKEQLSRLDLIYDLPNPELKIKDRGQTKLSDFEMDDFELINYKPLESIKAPMAV